MARARVPGRHKGVPGPGRRVRLDTAQRQSDLLSALPLDVEQALHTHGDPGSSLQRIPWRMERGAEQQVHYLLPDSRAESLSDVYGDRPVMPPQGVSRTTLRARRFIPRPLPPILLPIRRPTTDAR